MPLKQGLIRLPDQGVRNRNAKVVRRYETSCKIFEKEYKAAMQAHSAKLADDLLFAYYLLKQMEKYEDEKLEKKNITVQCTFNVPQLKLGRSSSKAVPNGSQTERLRKAEVTKTNGAGETIRPLTAPAGRPQANEIVEKKSVVRRYRHRKTKDGKIRRAKPTRSKSAPLPSHNTDEIIEDTEPLPPTPVARFTRTYEYNRKVLLCRSRQEERRLEKIKEEMGDDFYDNDEYDSDDDFVVEDIQATRKHDYWMWKIDVLFEKWRRNDRNLDDEDIYSLYEDDLDEQVFDDSQVQSYLKPGLRQINTLGRRKLVQFTKDKVLRYRWAFAGEGYKGSEEDNRKNRRKFVTAELSQKQKKKIRSEAEIKVLKVKRLVQESDYLRNEVYLMAPFYKTKQALIAKVATDQPELFL